MNTPGFLETLATTCATWTDDVLLTSIDAADGDAEISAVLAAEFDRRTEGL